MIPQAHWWFMCQQIQKYPENANILKPLHIHKHKGKHLYEIIQGFSCFCLVLVTSYREI